MPKASQLIAQILEEAGVEYVFGLPGGGTIQIFDALYGSGIKPVLVRHEHTAAIMADAYGRATGKPAVIMGQGLFMGSNASFGIMEAFLSSSPMVVLTDTSDANFAQHAANQSGAGEYGSVDLLGLFRSMTKYTTLATSPKEAAIGTQLALKHAMTGRPGPACVLMRSSAIGGEVDLERPPYIHGTQGYLHNPRTQAAPEDVARATDLLAKAKRPALFVGHGVRLSRATDEVQALAERWGMPVATSYKGKSAISERHPLAVGMAGTYGTRAANAAIAAADVVLVAGAMLRPQDTMRQHPNVWDPRRQKIIQIDVDGRNAGWAFPTELSLVGDAKAILGQLVEASEAGGAEAAQRASAVAALKAKAGFYADPSLVREGSPVPPQRLVRVLQETLDDSALVTLDAGNNRLWMCMFYQPSEAGTLFAPGGTAGMGWAVPAAMALKLVHPDRQAVAVTGDGGFMMSVHALSTAVQYEIPMVSVVMNDSALGMVRHGQGNRLIASEFAETDHATIAKGFGAYGVRVDDSRDVGEALRDALGSGRPAVVDVIVDRDIKPSDYFPKV